MEKVWTASRGEHNLPFEEDDFSAESPLNELMTNSAPQLRELGINLLRTGRTKAALGWFQKSVEADPKDTLSHYLCAIAFKALGKSDEAHTEWQTVLSLHQQDDSDNWAHVKAQQMLEMSM